MTRRLAAAGLLVLATVSFVLLAAASRSDTTIYDGPFDPGRLAGHIPQPMLDAYLDAAETWDIDWALLAAIGKLECDHFRSRLPGCWPPGSVNPAGGRGPMQLSGSTWRTDADTHDIDGVRLFWREGQAALGMWLLA